MSLTWLPNTTKGCMVGDDISTTFSGAPAYPALALANAPSGGLFDEGTYTVRGGLNVTGAGARSDERRLRRHAHVQFGHGPIDSKQPADPQGCRPVGSVAGRNEAHSYRISRSIDERMLSAGTYASAEGLSRSGCNC